MENTPKNIQDIFQDLFQNQNYLKQYVSYIFLLRKLYFNLIKEFYSNNKNGIEYNFEKLYESIKKITNSTNQYKDFYKKIITNNPTFTILQEDFYKFFNIEQNIELSQFIFFHFSQFYLINNCNEFNEGYVKNQIKTEFKYINYEFRKKEKEFNDKLKNQNINEINLNNRIALIFKSFFPNMKIKFLNKNLNEFPLKIFFSVRNLFYIFFYYDLENIKLNIGGKKEHYSFHKNRYSFFKSKKIYSIETSSKFIIYEKLKKFLIQRLQLLNLEMRDSKNHYLKILYFLKIISYYSNLFKQECGLCNKILKFNLIDKLFYPPLIYYNENSHNNILN
jgi:hypothetical protein